MVYFAEGVGQFYMSQDACMELGIITREFPAPVAPVAPAQQSLTGPYGSRNHGTINISSGMPQSKVQPVSNACFPYVQQPEEVQGKQAPGAEQIAHGILGARETALQGLKETVLEGAVRKSLIDRRYRTGRRTLGTGWRLGQSMAPGLVPRL